MLLCNRSLPCFTFAVTDITMCSHCYNVHCTVHLSIAPAGLSSSPAEIFKTCLVCSVALQVSGFVLVLHLPYLLKLQAFFLDNLSPQPPPGGSLNTQIPPGSSLASQPTHGGADHGEGPSQLCIPEINWELLMLFKIDPSLTWQWINYRCLFCLLPNSSTSLENSDLHGVAERLL